MSEQPENPFPGEKTVLVEFLRNVMVRGRAYDLGKCARIPVGDAKALVTMEKARLVTEPLKTESPAPAPQKVPGLTVNPQETASDAEIDAAANNGDSGEDVAAVDPADLTDDQKIDKIVEAIETLDPDNEKHFTKKGEPDATILTGIVGFQVTKKLRAAAMSAIKAAAAEAETESAE